MTRIDLLPASYSLARQRKAQLSQVRLWVVALTVALLGWGAMLTLHLGQANRQTLQAKALLPALEREMHQLQALHRQRDQLQAQAELLDRLRDPIAPAAMIALLTRLFPEQAVLQSLVIQVPPPAQTAALVRDPRSPQHRIGAKQAGASAMTRRPIVMQLDGLVVSDVIAAQLARQLAQSGLFQNVRIENTQQLHQSSQTFHQFRVSIEIPTEQSSSPTTPVSRMASR